MKRFEKAETFLTFSVLNAQSRFPICSSSQMRILQKEAGEMHITMQDKVKACRSFSKAVRFFFFPSSDCNGVTCCYALGSGPTNWCAHFAIGRIHPLEVAGVTAAAVSLTLIPCQQLRFIYIHACLPGTRPVTKAGPPASL